MIDIMSKRTRENISGILVVELKLKWGNQVGLTEKYLSKDLKEVRHEMCG